MNLLIAAVILTCVLWGVRYFANTNPAVLARNMRMLGGGAVLAGAGFLALRGMLQFAVPLAAFGLSILMQGSSWFRNPVGGWGGRPAAGRTSQIRTQTLEMSLDHDSGALAGRVLQGKFSGRNIEDLAPASVAELWAECRWSDPQSAQLLEAYLDRAHPDWRERLGPDAGASSSPPATASGQMTRTEAYRILGLEPGADAEEVRHAHRELMLKLHPDLGGSNYLAAKINEAKAVLLDK